MYVYRSLDGKTVFPSPLIVMALWYCCDHLSAHTPKPRYEQEPILCHKVSSMPQVTLDPFPLLYMTHIGS